VEGGLEQEVALVTGAGGGIGRAICLEIAAIGVPIAVVDISEELGTETARAVIACGGRATFFRADVSSSADAMAYVRDTESNLGPITMFANNAGVEGVIARIDAYPDDVFDRVMQVNVRGVFLGLKHVLKGMIERKRGAIVNIASTSAIRGRAGLAGYVAAKHAVLGLTRVAALDVAGTRVRVNAVLPGPIETRMIHALDDMAKHANTENKETPVILRAGSATYGEPEDVAKVVRFLLSDEANHVNGAAWIVDAGSTVS